MFNAKIIFTILLGIFGVLLYETVTPHNSDGSAHSNNATVSTNSENLAKNSQGSSRSSLVTTDANASIMQESQSSKASSQYSYIPRHLTQRMAIRFLTKATFGASSEDVRHLQKIGVQAWLKEQFAKPYEEQGYLKHMIALAKAAEPQKYNASIQEYLANNDKVFGQDFSFFSIRYFISSWFGIALKASDQLRHKVAYALSQIIVQSNSESLFNLRAEALAHYFDILAKNAFGSYQTLLETISFSPGMGVYLTYNGNRKKYLNEAGIPVYPDENYAREIMQLFSIGLKKLRLDGTTIVDSKGRAIPTYTQEDVNELARVFTGWDLQHNRKFGEVGNRQGDFTHPMEATPKYHDFGQKTLLGQTIPANLSPQEDIKRAIAILMSQPSVAPYIARHLIMRLAKSNPTPGYIRRVATIFRDTHGNLQAVVQAIFLDPEFWEDLREDKPQKFKEPLIAYTQFLRAMHVKALPKWYVCSSQKPMDSRYSNCSMVYNSIFINDPKRYLAQGAGLAPSVFNFYDNDFVPNDEAFKDQNLKAPEVQIQSDLMFIHFSNKIQDALSREIGYIQENYFKDSHGKWQKYKSINNYIAKAYEARNGRLFRIGQDKFLLDAHEEYDVLEKAIDGDSNGDFAHLPDFRQSDGRIEEKALRALVDFVDNKFNGGILTNEQKDILINSLKQRVYIKSNDESHGGHQSKKYQLFIHVIAPLIRAIVTSDSYMVE